MIASVSLSPETVNRAKRFHPAPHLPPCVGCELKILRAHRDEIGFPLLVTRMSRKGSTKSPILAEGIREDVLQQKLSLFFGSSASFEKTETKDRVCSTPERENRR